MSMHLETYRRRGPWILGATVMALLIASCSSSSGSGSFDGAATNSHSPTQAHTTSAKPVKLLRPLKPLKQPSARCRALHTNATLVRFKAADGTGLDGVMVGSGTVGVVLAHGTTTTCAARGPSPTTWPSGASEPSRLTCAASAAQPAPKATPPTGWSTTSSPSPRRAGLRPIGTLALLQ